MKSKEFILSVISAGVIMGLLVGLTSLFAFILSEILLMVN